MFTDGPFTATLGGIDFDAGKIAVGFDGGADGTLSFGNCYLAGPPADVYVDDAWIGLPDGTPVQFPGETTYRTVGVDAFAGIQDGINNVSASTVNVAAGAYSGNLTVNKSVSLYGAQAGIDARNRSATESVISASSGNVIYVSTGGVTIDGFQISGGGAGKLVFVDSGTNLVFQNNILDGTAGNGLYFGSSSSDVTIHRNEFEGSSFSSDALFFDGGSDVFDNLVISDNNVLNGDMFAGAKSFNSTGMMMSGNLFDGGDANLSSAFQNSTIDGNTFRNNLYTNMQVGFKNGTISNNVFECAGPSPGAGYPSYGLMLWGDQYGLAPSENVDVENNYFYYNEIASPGEPSNGLRILSGIDATTIRTYGNAFEDAGVQSGCYGLTNQATGTTDASANWWDTNDDTEVPGKISGDTDYTPWLDDGADVSGGVGFQGDFSELWVDDSSPQTGTTGYINEGIDLVSGSTVHVVAGTYNENVLLDKSIELLGEDGAILDGTTVGNEAIYVDIGGVTIDNFEIRNYAQGILIWIDDDYFDDWTDIVLTDNTIHDMSNGAWGFAIYVGTESERLDPSHGMYDPSMPGLLDFTGLVISRNELYNTSGAALVLQAIESTGTPMVVSDNYIHDSDMSGIWIDSAHDFSIAGNTIDDNAHGIFFSGYADGYYEGTPGTQYDPKNITVTGNFFSGNQNGVNIWDCWCDQVFFNYNSFTGNTSYGMINNLSACTAGVDAEYNWWGDADGPSGSGPGAGDPVSDYVDYDPWLGQPGAGNIICVPDPQYLTSDDPTKAVDVDYLGGGSGLLYGYSITFCWDGSVAATSPAQVTEGNLLDDVGDARLFAHASGANEITVDCALLGGIPGAAGPGTMFTVEFDAVATGTSPIEITINAVRDNNNNPLSGFYADDGLLIVDNVDPVFTINGPFPDGECYNTDPVLDLEASDDDDLDDAFYRIDGGAWTVDAGLFTDYSGATWSNGSWTLPGFAGLSEGSHTVEFYCTDDMGNTSNIPAWSFIKDTIDPPAVTDFASAPGHEKVELSWTNPGSDFDHVIVVRKPWSAGSPCGYPEYPQPADGYPTGLTDGVQVYSGIAESYTDNHVDRSIYFYRAFAVDCAGNFNGGSAPGGNVPPQFAQGDRSTNYWLGDVDSPYDGYVDYDDLVPFSGAYWSSPPSDPECDFGPSDDFTGVGIPLPDDYVGFEDLMIFAINFGNVSPKVTVAPLLAGAPTSSDVTLSLSLLESTESTMRVSLVLDGNAAEVKGLSATVKYDPGSLELVSVEELTASVPEIAPVFVSHRDLDGTVVVDLAVLGQGVVIGGSGELLELSFQKRSASATRIELSEAKVRGVDNGDIGELGEGTDVVADQKPVSFALYQNHPNPFNPVTVIAYSMAEAGHVELKVFNSNGQLIRTLVDEFTTAGSHSARWNGTDDSGMEVSSGVYFYGIKAADFTETRKMILMK
jgi:parallel beta-helix repeat protein